MVPVPDYQLIHFLSWLIEQEPNSPLHRIHRMSLSKLIKHASEFLQAKEGEYAPSLTLEGLMLLFQFSYNGDPNIYPSFEDFLGRYKEINTLWSPNEHSHLHSFLGGFILRWYSFVHKNSANELLPLNNEDLPEVSQSFRVYIDEVTKTVPELVRDFVSWSRDTSTPEEGHTPPLTIYDRRDMVELRLAYSAKEMLEARSQARSRGEPSWSRPLHLLSVGPRKDFSQAIEFVDWLAKNELLLPPGLEEVARIFCYERKYENVKEIVRWVSDDGSETILSKIAHFLGVGRRPRLPNGNLVPHNPLTRYCSVRLHGLFLFLSAGNFPDFFDKYWQDLNSLTQDYMDILFSPTDLKKNTDGKTIADSFKSISISAEDLPALLLWEGRLKSAVLIYLGGLNYEQVYEVVRTIVLAAKGRESLEEIAEKAIIYCKRTRTGGTQLYIEIGAIVEKNNVVNGGQVGFVGDGNTVGDISLVNSTKEASEHVCLSSEDGALLTELARELTLLNVEGLEVSAPFEGAAKLASIAAAIQGGEQSPTTEIDGWKSWFEGLGVHAQTVKNVLSRVSGLGATLSKALGF